MNDRDRVDLQRQLLFAHKEAITEDKYNRNINRIYCLHLDNILKSSNEVKT